MRNAIISKLVLNAAGAATSTDSGNAGNVEILDVDVAAVTATSITLTLNHLHKCDGVILQGTVDSGGAFVANDAVVTITNPTSGTGKPTITIANGASTFTLANLKWVRVMAYGCLA